MWFLNICTLYKLCSDVTALSPGQEQVVPGCFLRARAIGLMPMIDQVRFHHHLFKLKMLYFMSAWTRNYLLVYSTAQF